MSTHIGKVNIDYLLRPGGTAYEFITYLAANANRIGQGCALGFYLRAEMEQIAKGFLNRREAEPEEQEEVKDWIESLTWNENGYLALAFNW
jgi:hypothetical protein